jgi:CspA family cold shock protein
MEGKIKRIIRKKGFGFISTPEGEEVFFHHSDLIGSDFNNLEEEDAVLFKLEKSDKGPRATHIQRHFHITLTELAKEKLKETIQTKATKPELSVRIIPSAQKENCFKFVLDREREGDFVFLNAEGLKVLLLQTEVALNLEGYVIDYKQTSGGAAFTIN